MAAHSKDFVILDCTVSMQSVTVGHAHTHTHTHIRPGHG